MLEAFRNEIVEAEKSRIDLLKSKLLLIAGLGAVGLGLPTPMKIENPILSTNLLLCMIPLVCIYVDSLCHHLQIRILVISGFFQNCECKNDDNEIAYYQAYEKFCNEVRPVFYLEDWAQQGSTIVLSLIILVTGLTLGKELKGNSGAFFVSGILGIALTIALEILQRRKIKSVHRKSKNLPQIPLKTTT
jgi:hypothetical protein